MAAWGTMDILTQRTWRRKASSSSCIVSVPFR